MNKSTRNDWIGLVETPQKEALARLLEIAPRSAEEHVHKMLSAPPFPSDQTDAEARVSAVIAYLTDDGYRVGDLRPSTRY